MKRVIYLFMLCIVIAMNCSIAFAQTRQDNIENIDTNNDFLDVFYGGEKEIYVTDDDGNIVTEKFLSETQAMYNNRNMEAIREIIGSKNLVLHIITEKSKKQDSITTFAYEQHKTVRSEMFYFELTAQNGSRITVTSELSGGIWYNANTLKVTRVSNATYTILSTDPSIGVITNNFRTGSNVTNGKGYFWGECSFESHTQIIEQGVAINLDIPYGSKRVAFYAAP